MKYRAMIKKSGNWWTGWLIEFPGGNAQEKKREEVIQSLIIEAEDLLTSEVPFEPGAQRTTVEVADPAWP